MKIKVFLLTIFMLLFLTGCSLFGEVTKEPTKIPTIVETEDPLKTHTPPPLLGVMLLVIEPLFI